MQTRPDGSSAVRKEYNGFTVTILHDSSKCLQCEQFDVFYKKWRDKKLQLHQKTEMRDINAKYNLVNLITYLDKFLQVEFVPQTPIKKKISISRVATKVIQNVPHKKNNQSNKNNKRTLKNNRKSEKGIKSIQKRSSKKTSPAFCIRKKGIHGKCDADQSKVIESKTPAEKVSHSEKRTVKLLNETSPYETSDTANKLPGKGTLKRKRMYLDKLKTNDGYEDDIFEERKFFSFQDMLDEEEEEELDFNDVQNMSTPTWSISLSPREQSESPQYEDCYNPAELSVIRKEAEEYQYRRHKRRKSMMLAIAKEDVAATSKDKIKKESPDTSKLLDGACKLLMKQSKHEKDSDNESEADSYFTDSSEDSGKTEKII